MAIFNTIIYSSLRGAKRLEAEYYRPNYMHLMSQLCNKPNSVLGRIAFITDGIHASIDYDENSDIYCLSAQSVKNGFFDFSAHTMISNSQHQYNLRTSIKAGDVIISSMGTIGLSAVAYPEMLPANSVRQVLIVRPKSLSGNFSYYLAAFLNSKYGLFQSLREATGNVQQHLFIDKVVRFRIPQLLIQDRVGELYKVAEQKLISSCETMNLAEQFFLSELGLQNWKPQHTTTFVRNYSQAAQARRMDADHFQTKYAKLRAYIRDYPHGFCKITDIATNSSEMADLHAHPEQQFEYIELADINQVIGTIESTNKIIGKDAPSRARMLLRTGDVVTSTVEGSLDKVALVSEEHNGAIGSTGFFVLRPRTVQSGYLLALTRSIIVREQMRCEASGTILAAISSKSLQNIIVPNFPPEKRKEIARLVQQSHAARREAKVLLEKAKHAVEMAIEEGEDKAMEMEMLQNY